MLRITVCSMAALFSVAIALPIRAAEVLRLDFENGASLALDTGPSAFNGAISSANFGGSITQSTDVPSSSSGTGSALFSQLDFENGMFIEFLDAEFPDFTADDSFTVSLWVKPSTTFTGDGQGFRGIISGNTLSGNSDWQIDNGGTVEGGAGDGTTTGANLNGPPSAAVIPEGDLVADQWTQVSIAFVGPAKAGVIFIGDESTPLAFSSAAAGGNGFAAEDLIIGANRNKVRLYDGLLDEVVVDDTAIFYDGSGGSFQPGDLDFSGGIPDVDDWLAFRASQGVDLSAETALGAYGRGDVDFDGDNDLADFVAFRTLFNDANGVGALEALIAVPEPSTTMLLLLGTGYLLGYRRRNTNHQDTSSPPSASLDISPMRLTQFFAIALAALFLFLINQPSIAQEVRFDFGDGNFSANNSENDGLGNFIVGENQLLGASPGDLSQTINGVQMTIRPILAAGADFGGSTWGSNTQGIGIRSNDTTGTPIEAGASGGQRRIDGSIGEGIQFFFDADVSLTSVRLGSFAANATISETVEFTYVSGGADPFGGGSLTITNEDTATAPGTDMPINNVFLQAGTILNLATTASETVGQGVLLNGLNVFAGTPPEPLTLQVNTGTGEISLLNNSTGPIDIDYLRFVSEDVELNGGSLAPGSYTGLAGAAGFPAGNNDGTGWEAADNNDALEVIESYLTGMSTIPNDGQPISLGNAFVPGASEDLAFTYHVAGEGAVETAGLIEYVSSPGVPGDFDADLDVDGADFLAWQRGFPVAPLDAEGLKLWEENFGTPNTLLAATSSIPEPTAGILLWLATSIAFGSGIQRRAGRAARFCIA